MFVGDVRCATTGSGISWKLSGGNILSADVTNVSKKRQVRLAMRRRARASVSASGRRAPIRGDRLAQKATAGEANQATANADATGHVPNPINHARAIATAPMTTAPDIWR